MKKQVLAALLATSALLMVWGAASATPYTLVSHYVRGTSSGTMYSMRFKTGTAQGCPGPTYIQPCYNTNSQGAAYDAWLANTGVIAAVTAAGAPTWDWDGTTLTETGLYWATAQNINPWFGDRVMNLTINTLANTTNATSYDCVNGYLLDAIIPGAQCENISYGEDFVRDSNAVYNVGGDPKCVTLTITGDDQSLASPPGTPYPRGLTAQAAGGGCVATAGGIKFQALAVDTGAFDLWEVIQDDANYLILANTTTIGTCYLYGSGSSPACPADSSLAGVTLMVLAPDNDADGIADADDPDDDNDTVADGSDNCSLIYNPTQANSDSDAYGDSCDNCRLVTFANQCNTDIATDPFGNRCDGDLNQNQASDPNAVANAQDYAIFRARLGGTVVLSPLNNVAAADMNCTGDASAINAQDYAVFRSLLGAPPGPGACPAEGLPSPPAGCL